MPALCGCYVITGTLIYMTAIDAVTGRRSVRAFLSNPVSEATIHAILSGASRAAPATNIQPWLVHAVRGEARARLSQAAITAQEAGDTNLEYAYLPETMKKPYLSRRRKVGYDLFAKYGIGREDYAARKAAMLRNYSFFGAPVGLFFVMDRDNAMGAWLDCGVFMQNVMVLARAYGQETCPQQAWCEVGSTVHRELNIPQNHIVLSGMALGYPDIDAPVNRLVSDREPVEAFATWHG